MSTFRLEIVTAREGLEPFVWKFFPRLLPTAQSESFVIYACRADEALDEAREHLLESWMEEDIIIAYRCVESDRPILNLYVTPVEAEAISGYSEEYWRQQAWQGRIPGAIKLGKQHLLPRDVVENQRKPQKGGKNEKLPAITEVSQSRRPDTERT